MSCVPWAGPGVCCQSSVSSLWPPAPLRRCHGEVCLDLLWQISVYSALLAAILASFVRVVHPGAEWSDVLDKKVKASGPSHSGRALGQIAQD